MCMFCAAIPAAAAVGAKLDARQRSEIGETQAGDESARGKPKPVKAMTAGVIVVLLAASLFYHTHYSTLF